MKLTKPNLLVVHDAKKTKGLICRALEADGNAVEALGARTAGERIGTIGYDLLLLDWSGLTLCRELRALGSTTPVMMLTPEDGLESKLEAFEAGVDDYLTVPFHLEELVARVHALLRRHDVIRAGDLLINVRERVVFWGATQLDLTGREFTLLSLLVRNAGRVLTREQLYRKLCGSPQQPGSNLIDVHVRSIRVKLGAGATHLKAVRGRGYCYEMRAGSRVAARGKGALVLEDPRAIPASPGVRRARSTAIDVKTRVSGSESAYR